MENRRLTQRLSEYWDRLRKDMPLPQIERFAHSALEDLMGRCCIWRVEISGTNKRIPAYTTEYIGEELKNTLGIDIKEEIFSPQFKNFPAARVLVKMEKVVADATIVTDEGQFVNENNKIVKYRSCLLPFGTKDGVVTNVLFAISWRIY